MNITPENAVAIQHQDWLKHPVTRQLISNLEKHRNLFIKTLSSGAGNTAELEISFRLQAYGLRTTDAILAIVTDTNKFIELSERKEHARH